MELHEKLQALRRQRGCTQEELSRRLYVSRTAVSKWESGRGIPGIDSLKAISQVFGVSIDSLLSGEELLGGLLLGFALVALYLAALRALRLPVCKNGRFRGRSVSGGAFSHIFTSNSPSRLQQRYSFPPPRSWGMRNSPPCSGYSRTSSTRSVAT